MYFLRSLKFLTSLSLAVSLGLIIVSGGVGVTQAQNNPEPLDFQPPNFATSSNGDPGDSASGGKRNNDSLIVLIPRSLEGLTVSGYPTFFLFFKENPVEKFYFFLEDQDNNIHYEGDVTIITDASGISRISFPEDAQALEIGKTYSLFLYSDDEILIENIKIQRVASFSETGSYPEVAAEYASQGIWFDLMKTLADWQEKEPNNPEVRQAWKDILEDEDVDLATEVPELLQ